MMSMIVSGRTNLPGVSAATLAVLSMAGMLGAAAPAAAQLHRDLAPESAFRIDPMRDLTSTGGRPLAAAPSSSAPPVSIPALRAPGWLGSAVQIEPSRLTSSGTYTRPRIVFGLPSHTMRNWMNDNGIAADRCYLPMVRARARLSAEGEASGSLMLYARCTFQ
jgi:hypothetical protein